MISQEAHAEEDITRGLEALSPGFSEAEDSLSSPVSMMAPPPPPSPVALHMPPPLPGFGMGLRRQASFAPPSVLTSAEVARQREVRGRCAAALGKLARQSFRSLPPPGHAKA